MRKLLIASLVFASLASALIQPRGAPLTEENKRSPFVLELPEAGGQAITAAQASIPSAQLTRITLRVLRPYADAIDYGKIHTAINGEAADVIFDRTSDLQGYVLRGDLTLWPRFRLKPGKNVIEVSAVDRNRSNFYASYVLLTGAPGGASGTGATVESVPVAAGADREPPQVSLSQPKGPVRTSGAPLTVAVAGTAADDSGVVASVKVNGRAARLLPAGRGRALTQTSDDLAAKPGAVNFDASVTLGGNASSLVVEAQDRAGNVTRLNLPVRRREAAVGGAFNGRKYALVVGVSRYLHHEGGLGDLAYADVDARAVRDFLQSREGGGFAPSDILYLENEQATVASVRGALETFLPKASSDDLILIYIAGHGGPDPYAPKDLYFVLHDTKVADLPRTALPMAELQRTIEQRVRAERLVVFVDTCHSAGLSGQQFVSARGLENNLINLYAARLFSETGRAVMTSSDVNEIAQEGKRWGGGHGVFSWALLEGLRGEADLNGDHFVTAGELFDFVQNRVSVETGGRQNPRVLPGLNADLTLAVARGK